MAKATFILKDGYAASLAATGSAFDVTLDIVSLTPPGFDGGDMIDTTTMSNAAWRTFHPRSLITLTEFNATCAYDPAVLDTILTTLNVNLAWTLTFPDKDGGAGGATWVFWAVMRMADPGELAEGEMPTFDVTLTPTNTDATGAEVAPTYTAPVA
jgi:hypothetical protein